MEPELAMKGAHTIPSEKLITAAVRQGGIFCAQQSFPSNCNLRLIVKK